MFTTLQELPTCMILLSPAMHIIYLLQCIPGCFLLGSPIRIHVSTFSIPKPTLYTCRSTKIQWKLNIHELKLNNYTYNNVTTIATIYLTCKHQLHSLALPRSQWGRSSGCSSGRQTPWPNPADPPLGSPVLSLVSLQTFAPYPPACKSSRLAPTHRDVCRDA